MSETEKDRKKRLAEALRTNLRRRKAQSREGAVRGDIAQLGDAPEDTSVKEGETESPSPANQA